MVAALSPAEVLAAIKRLSDGGARPVVNAIPNGIALRAFLALSSVNKPEGAAEEDDTGCPSLMCVKVAMVAGVTKRADLKRLFTYDKVRTTQRKLSAHPILTILPSGGLLGPGQHRVQGVALRAPGPAGRTPPPPPPPPPPLPPPPCH